MPKSESLIAMNDAAVVSVLQGSADLDADPRRFFPTERTTLLQGFLQAATVDQFHRVVAAAVVVAVAEDADDVRMAEHPQAFNLGGESIMEAVFGAVQRGQHLHGDRFPRHVGRCGVDGPHPAATDAPVQPIRAETFEIHGRVGNGCGVRRVISS